MKRLSTSKASDETISPALEALAASGIKRQFPKKTRFITEGEEGTSIYVVLAGRVRVFTSDERGKEFIFGLYGPGSIIGEMAIDGQPRSASVEAITDVTCAIVSVEALRQRIATDPDFSMSLILLLIQRSRDTTTFARQLALENAYERMVTLLDGLAVDSNGERVVSEPMSQQDIADRIGTSRDMVSRIFKELTKGNYLKHEKKRITFLRDLPRKW
jgi:CRP/FNR family cyclic AMP-dependent transcriptional regulator